MARLSIVLLAVNLWIYTQACSSEPSAQPKAQQSQNSLKPIGSTSFPKTDSDPFSSPSSVTGTKVVMLGTGTPILNAKTAGPGVAIVVDELGYVVDMGAGVARRLQEAAEMGFAQLEISRATKGFITHLHSDHTLGYPEFIFTPWILGRSGKLDVYGPKGLMKMTEHIQLAWNEDLAVRQLGKGEADQFHHSLNVHEISAGVIYTDSRVVVTAIDVQHGEWEQAFGYKFKTPDKTIVVSGDTAPCQSIIDACNGCDILIHEVYSHFAASKGTVSWQKYHSAYHSSSVQLAEMARRAKPKLLVLYHQLLFGQSEEGLLREITELYDGEVVYGRDLDVF